MEPTSVKEILQKVLNKTGLDKKMEECEALLLWGDVAPNLAARTKPVGIGRGRLVINVANSVILHQLTFYKKRYIDKINLMLGKRIVKDIIFRVGKVERREKITESRDDYIKKFHSVQLEQDQIARIDEIVAQVDDKEIQGSLRELFISQSKLNKIREEEL